MDYTSYEFIEIGEDLLYCEQLGIAITREALNSIDDKTLQFLFAQAEAENELD